MAFWGVLPARLILFPGTTQGSIPALVTVQANPSRAANALSVSWTQEFSNRAPPSGPRSQVRLVVQLGYR